MDAIGARFGRKTVWVGKIKVESMLGGTEN